MSLFDTLFPPRMRSPAIRRPSARTRATIRRHRNGAFGEQLEQRLALAVTFAPRFTIDAPGDITFAANTMMTAVEGEPGTATQVTNAQNGTGSNPSVWNDDFWRMQYINVDPTDGNFASSAANLSLPAGANVLFAGLYYGSRTNQNVSDDVLKTVKLKGPGDASYTTLSGAAGPNQVTLLGKVLGQVSNLPPDVQTYGAFANVTDLVFARGQGTYTIANIQGDPGIINHFAGWSLVVAYDAPGANLRNLSVFDGFADVSASNPNVEVNFTGFTAPPSGPVKANLGFVSYEGDLGIDNDTASFFGGISTTQLSNATNPADNFFNSSISTNGVTVTSKNPNYLNQLGFDADILNIDGKIANGATTAKLTLTSTQDQYYPAVVTSAIDLYAPKVSVDKSVVDVNGGIVEPGDTLRYTITVANDANAFDTAANVILDDAIPTFTTYKPNSLFVTAGANSSLTAKTDAIDADQAEALPTGATPPTTSVRFQLGAGAAGGGPPPVGGELAKGESTTVTFEVTVNAGFPSEGFITNTAIVNYTSKFTGKPFSTSDTASIQCPPVLDLAITKTSPGSEYVPGALLTYSFTVTNNGPAASPGSIVTDTLPAQTTFNPVLNPLWTLVGTTLTYATPALGSGGSTSFALVLLPASDRLGDLVNTATIAVPPGFFDRNLANNTATETDTAKPTVNLTVTKTDVPASTTYVPGDPVIYSIVVTNTGPSFLKGGLVTDSLPFMALSGSWTATTSANIPGLPVNKVTPSASPVGVNDINATVDLAPGSFATFTYTVQTKSDATADLVNTVIVTPPAGQGSSTSSTDRDTATPQVNLTVTKTDSSDTYIPGNPVTYTIVVTNTGPSALVGGTVTDLLPSVATSGNWTTSTTGGATVLPILGGDNINATVNIPKNGSVTFTYIVQTKPIVIPIDPVTGPYPDLFNLVTVFLPPGTTGNTATATDNDTAAPQVDLAVTKTRTSALPVIAGEVVTYSIVVSSNGPSSITTFSGTDISVPGLLSPTYSVSTGTYNPNTGIWTANPGDTFDDGESVTFTLSGTVPAGATGTLTNTATGTPPIFDPNPDNNTSTATDTIVVKPVLSISKTDGKGTYVPGTSTVYTIVATNAGPSFLAGGTVSDPLPAQVSSATWTAVYSAGSSGPETGSGPLNETVNLAPGGTATFTFTVQIKPDATGDLVNTVTITPPPNTQGNTATATDTNTISSPQLLLNVTKTDGKTTYLPNQTFTYTMVVSNSGPSTMIDGVVNDPLPAQVAIASWTASYTAGSSGSPSGSGGITNEKITLLPGGNATFLLTVTIKPDAFGQMDNVVTLTPPAGVVVTPGSVLTATDTNFGPEPPASIGGALVVGSDDGCNGPPWVRVLDPDSGEELSRFLAYDSRFRGSVRVATGDVTGDGVAEIITAPSRNAIGEVRVFQQALGGWAELTQYRTLAFGPRYRGGVEVAVADIDGDGDNDIVTGMSIQSGMVNVFRVNTGVGVVDPVANTPFKSFRGAPAGTNNGVMISAGDYINGGIPGGPAEIAVGTNSGTRALVRIFDVSGAPTVVRSFKPFANNFRGGVTLSTSDYDGNGSLDLIVGAGLNGGSRVEVWNPATTTRIAQISAFGSLSKPNARVFAVFGSVADGFIGPNSALYGVQGLNGGRGSKGVWRVNAGTLNPLVNSQGSLPPLRIAPIALQLG